MDLYNLLHSDTAATCRSGQTNRPDKVQKLV